MVIIILKYNNRKYLINEFLRLFLSQIFMVLNFVILLIAMDIILNLASLIVNVLEYLT